MGSWKERNELGLELGLKDLMIIRNRDLGLWETLIQWIKSRNWISYNYEVFPFGFCTP
jgi:hypothetical protein